MHVSWCLGWPALQALVVVLIDTIERQNEGRWETREVKATGYENAHLVFSLLFHATFYGCFVCAGCFMAVLYVLVAVELT